MPRKPKRSFKSSKRASLRGSKNADAQQHWLNLEPESPVTREIESVKRVRWGFHIAAGLLVFLGLLALVRAAVKEAFEKDPRFVLKEVVVDTKGVLTEQKIVRVSGLVEGQNLMAVDLRDVMQRIEKLPQVHSARIERDFDGKLIIEVEQRQPVAWLESRKLKLAPRQTANSFLIDRFGVPVPCDVLLKEHLTLPVIRDEGLDTVSQGVAIRSVQMAAALKMVAELGRRVTEGKDGDRLVSVEVKSPFAMTACFSDGAEVIFGVDGIREQLARYARIRGEEKARGWQIATLNLLVEDNIPVTFRNVASVPADGGRRNTTPRARDRSVARRN